MEVTRRGGKKNRKYGRNLVKCKAWRLHHGGGDKKKIVGSKEHRSCGPLGYYNRTHKLHD